MAHNGLTLQWTGCRHITRSWPYRQLGLASGLRRAPICVVVVVVVVGERGIDTEPIHCRVQPGALTQQWLGSAMG
eukprot:2141377-Lingulodinium_polyedra.AAC.1